MQIIHALSLKRHGTVQHRIENDAGRPQVTSKAVSIFVAEDFRRNVSWSATLLLHLSAGSYLLTNTEVCNLHLPLAIEKNIIELDVSMCNRLLVDVLYTQNDLSEYVFRLRFFKFAPFSYIIEQITTGTELHDDDDVLRRLDSLVNLDNVIISQLQE